MNLKFFFKQIDPDLYLIEKNYTSTKRSHGCDITGPYCMLIEIKVLQGKIWWQSDGKKIEPTQSHLFIYIPPYTWAMEHCEAGTELNVRGLISKQKIESVKFTEPVLFYSKKPLPQSVIELHAFLTSVENFITIGANTNPSQLSARTKKLIDENYQRSIEIQEIALKLKSSPASLSRKFKSEFGQTPAFYRKGLRVTVGMYELMMGTPPIEAASLAGYRDLSRFYKQFKNYLKQTPSEYLKKSKNAKK